MNNTIVKLGGVLPKILENTTLSLSLSGWPATIAIGFVCTAGVVCFAIYEEAKQPATGEPETEQPATGEPEAEQPATGEPETEQPAIGEPETEQPATGEPETGSVTLLKVEASAA